MIKIFFQNESIFLLADGLILEELFNIRQNYTRKQKLRISTGTWNINGDKNPPTKDQYGPILDAWLFCGPENMSSNRRNPNAIPTMGYYENKKRN